ncbi:MAG: DUF3748 domain-containing protein, partial [Candidatus Hydrogenedentota bacterium]
DTREMLGPGIENSQSGEKVEIATGEETVLYAPAKTIIGAQAAPGVGAASYSWTENRIAFIHGPPLDQVSARGYYAKPNRNGASVPADGSGKLSWLDFRDVATDRSTTPGAHRGGTHRHEYSRNGKRIGFTYDDFLLPEYDRTIGYMEPHPRAPGGASQWFAILVPVARKGESRPGEIEKAYSDSWVDPEGTMRAFIGVVRESDGSDQESLFVVDVPLDVDITTANAGDATNYPSPPNGVSVRRLTHAWAGGVVRGSPSGDRIAYYAKDGNGSTQIFLIPSNGSDQSPDSAMRPVQATKLFLGAASGLRWHPSGEYIACISHNEVAVTCGRPGPDFGKTIFLTAQGGAPDRSNLVWSRDGAVLAYNKPVPDPKGGKNYNGTDFLQIFTVTFSPQVFGSK